MGKIHECSYSIKLAFNLSPVFLQHGLNKQVGIKIHLKLTTCIKICTITHKRTSAAMMVLGTTSNIHTRKKKHFLKLRLIKTCAFVSVINYKKCIRGDNEFS